MVALIYPNTSNIWECHTLNNTNFSYSGRCVVVSCFNMHFPDDCVVEHLFIYLLVFVYFSLWSVCLRYSPILFCLLQELWYMLGNTSPWAKNCWIFPPICGLPIYFCNDFIWWNKVFNLDEVWSTKIFSCGYCSCGLRNLCLHEVKKILSSFMVLGFIFRSMVYLKLILWVMWSRRSKFFFYPHMNIHCLSFICWKDFLFPLNL